MNDLAALLARQLQRELPRLPSIARARMTDAGRASRWGTIAELREGARRALPRMIFDFVDGAAGDEVTAGANERDLRAIRLRPRMLVDVSDVTLSTSVLGRQIAVPLLGAPMGLCGLLHPRGEIALARALHAVGSIYVLGAMASHSMEAVSEQTQGPLWFQMYLWRDRGLVAELLARSANCGHEALVLTVDVPRAAARDRDRRNGFGFPPRLSARTLAEGAMHPRWASRFARDPRIEFANVAGRDGGGLDPVSASTYINSQFDPTVTWNDLAWFREQWRGPIVVKGVLDVEDARSAVRVGAEAICVSNHGGRQLDHAPSTISVLAPIVDAVSGEAEVYLDGGIRRGSDVVKALALGARACLAGRPLAYGLGAAGESGARRAVQILVDELANTLALAGMPSVGGLDASDVILPGSGSQGSANRLV